MHEEEMNACVENPYRDCDLTGEEIDLVTGSYGAITYAQWVSRRLAVWDAIRAARAIDYRAAELQSWGQRPDLVAQYSALASKIAEFFPGMPIGAPPSCTVHDTWENATACSRDGVPYASLAPEVAIYIACASNMPGELRYVVLPTKRQGDDR